MPSRNVSARPLPWAISNDPILARVKDPWGKLLFTWLYPSTDNLGCIEGDPAFIKAQVFPLDDISTDEVEKLLGELHKVGALIWYRVGGLKFIFMPKFFDWSRLVGNMQAKSDFPPPHEEELRSWCKRTGNRYISRRGRQGDPRISFIPRSNEVRTMYGLKVKSKSKKKEKFKEKVKSKGKGKSEGEGPNDDRPHYIYSEDDMTDLTHQLQEMGMDINDIDRCVQSWKKQHIPKAVLKEAVTKAIEAGLRTKRNPAGYLRKVVEEKWEAHQAK